MYELAPLPYLYQDLEPYIDTHTMGLHYLKHQKNYLDKLNSLLRKNHYDYRYKIEEILYHIQEFPRQDQADILFNLGGVINHDLYWKSISSPKNVRKSNKLTEAINQQFGGLANFFEEFKKKALSLKGSGYTFLVMKNNGQLDIVNMPNQETPLMYGMVPLFVIDLWEHAYYLNYKNNKSEYIDNFIKIADLSNANNIYNNIVK